MYNRTVSGAQIDGLEPGVSRQLRVDGESLVFVRVGLDSVRPRQPERHIWLAERPVVRIKGARRQVLVFTLGRAALDPVDDQIYFALGQRGRVAEFTKTFDGMPGRHALLEHLLFDGFRPRARLFV